LEEENIWWKGTEKITGKRKHKFEKGEIYEG
jgi:hypothetical protein